MCLVQGVVANVAFLQLVDIQLLTGKSFAVRNLYFGGSPGNWVWLRFHHVGDKLLESLSVPGEPLVYWFRYVAEAVEDLNQRCCQLSWDSVSLLGHGSTVHTIYPQEQRVRTHMAFAECEYHYNSWKLNLKSLKNIID